MVGDAVVSSMKVIRRSSRSTPMVTTASDLDEGELGNSLAVAVIGCLVGEDEGSECTSCPPSLWQYSYSRHKKYDFNI